LALLERFLPSVAASSYPNLEVVLADNASSDDSIEWTRSRFPTVRIIRHPENWGFCKGNNEAIRQTDSEYVLLLNNDVEVESDWLQPLIAEMVAKPELAAVQPKLLDVERRSRFEYAGASGGHMDKHGFTFSRGRLFFTLEPDSGQYDNPDDIFWATGAAILLRRSCLDAVGLLDERFEFHMEEIDLCWRLQRAGFGIRVVPSSRVYHAGGSSLPRESTRKTYFNYRNSLLMLHNNLPRVGRRRTFAVRVLLDGLALLKSLLKLQGGQAAAIVRAYRDFIGLRSAPSGSSGISAKRAVDVYPSYRGSVVADYFLRGRKTFSSLPVERFERVE
jgi:GT2 family glycosyltransferase